MAQKSYMIICIYLVNASQMIHRVFKLNELMTVQMKDHAVNVTSFPREGS